MKLQILHAPTVLLHTCIHASFKYGLQTPFCITASTSQYLLGVRTFTMTMNNNRSDKKRETKS